MWGNFGDVGMYDLKELKKAANYACEKAIDNRTEIGGAVNWGDLKCISAEYCIDDCENESYKVIIDEADPGCWALKDFISKILCDSGFKKVEVVTEW